MNFGMEQLKKMAFIFFFQVALSGLSIAVTEFPPDVISPFSYSSLSVEGVNNKA